MEWRKDNYTITTDKSKVDLAYTHRYLSQDSYWAQHIPEDVVRRSIEGSLTFIIQHHEKQVGFARVITDTATFAYLADVFVDEGYRGKGLSKWLMEVILAHPSLQGLRRFLLATRDAHELYRQYGFELLSFPDRWMHKHDPDVYKRTVQGATRTPSP